MGSNPVTPTPPVRPHFTPDSPETLRTGIYPYGMAEPRIRHGQPVGGLGQGITKIRQAL
jgi:hypothetical protein